MGGDLTLIEQNMFFRVNARGDHAGRKFADVGTQFFGVLPDCDGMHIDDAEDAFEIFLQGNPVTDCAKIVAKMKVTGGLSARKHTFHYAVVHFNKNKTGFASSARLWTPAGGRAANQRAELSRLTRFGQAACR